MAIKISAALKRSIADELDIATDEVEERVWQFKGPNCFLCTEQMNRAGTETLELDHNIPRAEGGSDALENLNLTHASCNRYKRNNSTINVRPHLKFKRFYEQSHGEVTFTDALAFFEIEPSDTYVTISEDGQTVRFEAGEQTFEENIFSETVDDQVQRFCFVNLPISAVSNDDDIQPRQIKLNHLLSIAVDMKRNPLHEQPTCRLVQAGPRKRILMFDGQHKTVAKLINGSNELVFKVYLDLEREQAVRLVNSIQSRIKKLPLTPFEFATKMADEVRRQLDLYEAAVGGVDCSEAGFINWLDQAERSRARQGIASAVIDRLISDPNLAFSPMIERTGRPATTAVTIRETAFQNHLLKELAHHTPLPDEFRGDEMKAARAREARQLLRLLNILHELGFTANADEDDDAANERIRRLRYQPTLKYLAKMMKIITAREMFLMERDRAFLQGDISEQTWETITRAARLFFRHPIWTTPWDYSPKTQAVYEALNTNSAADQQFAAVGLDAAYCMGVQAAAPNLA